MFILYEKEEEKLSELGNIFLIDIFFSYTSNNLKINFNIKTSNNIDSIANILKC